MDTGGILCICFAVLAMAAAFYFSLAEAAFEAVSRGG